MCRRKYPDIRSGATVKSDPAKSQYHRYPTHADGGNGSEAGWKKAGLGLWLSRTAPAGISGKAWNASVMSWRSAATTFQLHVAALIMKETGRLLVVQQNGRWTFPGTYLVVGDELAPCALEPAAGRSVLARSWLQSRIWRSSRIETESSAAMPEAAVAKIFAVHPGWIPLNLLLQTPAIATRTVAGCRIREWWTSSRSRTSSPEPRPERHSAGWPRGTRPIDCL